jgi:hypothetical protein
MAVLEESFPRTTPDDDPVECSHDWVQSGDDGWYSGDQHVLVEFWSGQPGYAALPIDQVTPTALARAAAAGWRRCRVTTCGRGAPPTPEAMARAGERLQAALQAAGAPLHREEPA